MKEKGIKIQPRALWLVLPYTVLCEFRLDIDITKGIHQAFILWFTISLLLIQSPWEWAHTSPAQESPVVTLMLFPAQWEHTCTEISQWQIFWAFMVARHHHRHQGQCFGARGRPQRKPFAKTPRHTFPWPLWRRGGKEDQLQIRPERLHGPSNRE
jgi:hypothetical protein